MGRLTTFFGANGADLLFGVAAFLIIYLVARMMKASALIALSFATAPVMLAYFVLHPQAQYMISTVFR